MVMVKKTQARLAALSDALQKGVIGLQREGNWHWIGVNRSHTAATVRALESVVYLRVQDPIGKATITELGEAVLDAWKAPI